jgi:hypothetical protein
MHPIASIQATETTRRAVRGSGPGDAIPERSRRRASRAAQRRPDRAPAPAPARAGAPVRTVNVLDV